MSGHRWNTSALSRGLVAGLVGLALGAPGLASADPAARGSGKNTSAFRDFGKFAKTWMADLEKRERSNRAQPTLERTGTQSYATFTGYAPGFEVEVHATGDRTSPYVGILKYEEQVFACGDETTRRCSVKRTTPVTEVFPYRDGAWKY